MALAVTGKGDVTLLPRFNEGDFDGYELYLGQLDEFTTPKLRSLPAHINIVSIHTPTWVLVDGRAYPFDLGQPDPIGSTSLQALEQTIKLAAQCKAKVVVVHGASHNTFLESKQEAMWRLANRVRPLLNQKDVKLCFETDVLWHNLYYSRRALLTTAEDFTLLKNFLSGKLKMTADFEHLSITFHFLQFITHCGGEQEFLKKYSETAQHKFEIDAQQFIKDNYGELQLKFKENLRSFFNTFHNEIEHIHLNGSDCCHYLFNPRTSLPFIGEHLPLGLQEEKVRDRMDYPVVASLLHSLPPEKDIKVVMEIWRTDAAEFIKASRESKNFLEGHLDLGEKLKRGWWSMDGNKENTIFIKDRKIENFGKPFIIAEIGMNHNGDIDLAKKIIDAAKEAGADCAKFQSWTKRSLFSRKVYEGNIALEKDIDIYSFGLGDVLHTYRELKRYCDQKGIIFATSVFNEAEADFFVDELKMDFIKIASMDVNNLPFLEYLAKKGKPIILSTGLSTLAEIAEAVQEITKYNSQLIILHCLSVYPDAKQGLGASSGGELDAGINLNNLEMLRTAFGFPVGFSDNAPGIYIPLAAVAKGAGVIEKHFTIDKNMAGWDHAISADLSDMKLIVEGSHIIQAALGTSPRVLSSKEQNMRAVFRRSIVVKRDLPAGYVLLRSDLEFKRPGTGIEPKNWSLLMGRTLKRALREDELVMMEDLM